MTTSSVPSDRRVHEVLRQRAQENPDGPAIVYARSPLANTLTWRELDHWADVVAASLLARSLAPGDRCALILQDDPACHAAVHGVMRAGGVLVPLDPQWGRSALDNVLAHADVRFILGQGEQVAFERLGIDPRYRAAFVTWPEPARGVPEPITVRGSVDDLALLAFTSGTTSGPKGVMIRHRHLRAAYGAGRRYLFDVSVPRRFGCVYRLSGLGILGINYLLALEVGAATVVLPELTIETAARFWQTVATHEIEFVYLVPALVQLVNRLAQPSARQGGPPLCVTGAAPITEEAHRTFQERFGKVLLNIYGMTEASFAVFFGERDARGLGTRSIGPALAVEARLVDSTGQPIAGPGTGLLQIRGPMVTDGYWRNPEETRELFHDGWLVTGDRARRDERLSYCIVGRVKDVVIRGGFNIHLAEVDEVLLQHPAVIGAAAVGVSEPVSGEEVLAMVELQPGGPSESELLRWCRHHLGAARAPRRIVISSQPLPRNGAGKIVRREVLARVREALGWS